MAGEQFDIELGVKGEGEVASAAAELAQLATRLTAAGDASIAASEAVRAAEAAYRQTEGAADRVAKSLEKVGLAADVQRQKMVAALEAGDPAAFWRAAQAAENLSQRQAELGKKAETLKGQLASEAAALDKLKTSAAAAADAEGKIAKQLDAAKTASAAAAKAQAAAAGSGKTNEIAEGLGKLGGPLGKLGQQAFGAAEGWKKLSASLGSAGPYVAIAVAVVALVAGIAALTIAAGIATVKVAAWGVALANTNRNAELLAAGITQSAEGGKVLNKQIDDIAARVPVAKSELQSMAAELVKTGLKGEALGTALEDAAEKAAKAKYGPEWKKQMLSLEQQQKHFTDLIGRTFGGLKIDGLLEQISHLVSLFDTSNASGRAMKALFEGLFQPLIDGAAGFIPKMRSAFIQFEIMVLKAVLAMKPWKDEIILGAEVIGVMAAVLTGVLLIALGAVVASITILAAAIAFTVTVIAAIIAGLLYLGSTLSDVGVAIGQGFVAAWQAASDFLGGLSLVELGSNLITGLANGITSGGAAVLSAITGVVGGAIDSAKGLLGIASPSKVFAEIGAHTAEGMAGGVDAGAGDVQGSLESMVATPDAPAGDGSSGGLGGGTFFIEINASGEAGKGLGAEIRDEFTAWLEEMGFAAGTGVPDGG